MKNVVYAIAFILLLARPGLAAEGDLDTSFDTDGYVTINSSGAVHDYGWDMAVQTDGKIVIFGHGNNN